MTKDTPTPPVLPRSLLDLIGAYGCARTNGMLELDRLDLWERLIVGIKAYASQYNTDTERDLAECRAALQLAKAALEAGRVMWRSQKPAKLDEALSWRENDLKAEAMGDAALSAARAILQSDEGETK